MGADKGKAMEMKPDEYEDFLIWLSSFRKTEQIVSELRKRFVPREWCAACGRWGGHASGECWKYERDKAIATLAAKDAEIERLRKALEQSRNT